MTVGDRRLIRHSRRGVCPEASARGCRVPARHVKLGSHACAAYEAPLPQVISPPAPTVLVDMVASSCQQFVPGEPGHLLSDVHVYHRADLARCLSRPFQNGHPAALHYCSSHLHILVGRTAGRPATYRSAHCMSYMHVSIRTLSL